MAAGSENMVILGNGKKRDREQDEGTNSRLVDEIAGLVGVTGDPAVARRRQGEGGPIGYPLTGNTDISSQGVTSRDETGGARAKGGRARRIGIDEETGDVYVIGGENRPIGHIEDFVDQRTPLAKAVRICWKEYLRRLDRFAARDPSTNGVSAQRRTSDPLPFTIPYSDR